MRYEIKIPIFSDFNFTFEKWIRKSKGIRKHYEDRIVKSIYYDTNNLKNAKDNIDGISRRSKIRLRWYNDDFLKKKLEIKVKKNNLGEKIFLKLDNLKKIHNLKDVEKTILKKRYFLNHHIEHEKNQISKYIFDDLNPISMISYNRSYFKFENLIRITFDQNICYNFFQNNRKLNSTTKDHKNVIEFKFEKKNLDTARFLLDSLNLRPNRFSKYLRSLYFFNKAVYF